MEEQKTKNQEEKFLENSGLEHIREVATIMPTMIDDSIDDKEIKRDLSSIIPKLILYPTPNSSTILPIG